MVLARSLAVMNINRSAVLDRPPAENPAEEAGRTRSAAVLDEVLENGNSAEIYSAIKQAECSGGVAAAALEEARLPCRDATMSCTRPVPGIANCMFVEPIGEIRALLYARNPEHR